MDQISDNMELQGIEFLSELENILLDGHKILIDTNIIIPPMVFRDLKTERNIELIDFLLQQEVSVQDVRKITSQVNVYQLEYFEKVKTILDTYLNALTIDKVIEELEDYRAIGLRISRVKKDNHSKISCDEKIKWRYIKEHEKKIAKNIEYFLDLINDLHKKHPRIIKQGSLGSRGFYQDLFEIAYVMSLNDNYITINEKCADQHLVTTAYYLSCLSGERIYIMSRDKHIKQIMSVCDEKFNLLISRMKRQKQSIKEPLIYALRPLSVENEVAIQTYRNRI
jgi:hypothetical protein